MVHEALIYGSDREFMDVALPFVQDGLSAQQPTLVAAQERHVENLRSALGGTPDGVTLHPAEDWYETSVRTREKFARWVRERTARDGRARLIGEPPWALGREPQVRDWARHDSLINVAFAGLPVSFVCPYDARDLPEEILGHARSTHPEIVSSEGVSESDAYEDPLDFCGRLDAAVEVQHGEPALEIEFELQDLPAVRRALASFARDAGLADSRSDDLVLAVNEITSNAVIHGRPPSTVRAWRVEGELVLEVSDAGDGIRDVLAGQLTPARDTLGGRGIWLSRLFCDAVEVRSDPGGCTVRLYAFTPADRQLTAVGAPPG